MREADRGEQIQLERRVIVGIRRGVKRCGRRAAGVRDEDIDGTERVLDQMHAALRGARFGDITGDYECRPRDLRCHPLELRRATRDEGDGCTFRRQLAGNRRSQSR